jgi:hypothetical protein
MEALVVRAEERNQLCFARAAGPALPRFRVDSAYFERGIDKYIKYQLQFGYISIQLRVPYLEHGRLHIR